MGLYVFTTKVRALVDSMAVASRLKANTRYIADLNVNWSNIRENSRESEGRDIIKVDDIQFDVYKDHLTLHLPTYYQITDEIETLLRSLMNDLKIVEYFQVHDSKYVVEMPFYDEDSMIEELSRILLLYM